MRPSSLVVLVLALSLVAGGCSSQPSATSGDPLVNQPAPPTSGEDLEGRPLNLETYRGKVVALSFWASWCGPCMRLVPHERELFQKHQGQAFALLGVNCEDAADGRLAAERERMAWPSFADGDMGGPISSAWNIEGIPTVYVIDPQGIVRHKIVGAIPDQIDKAIETELAKVAK